MSKDCNVIPPTVPSRPRAQARMPMLIVDILVRDRQARMDQEERKVLVRHWSVPEEADSWAMSSEAAF